MIGEFVYPDDPQEKHDAVYYERESDAVQEVLILWPMEQGRAKKGDPANIQKIDDSAPKEDKTRSRGEFTGKSDYESSKKDHDADGIAPFDNPCDIPSFIIQFYPRFGNFGNDIGIGTEKFDERDRLVCNDLRYRVDNTMWLILHQEKRIEEREDTIGTKELREEYQEGPIGLERWSHVLF